jgi:hypothetical protein
MSTKIYRGKRLQDMSVYQLNQFYKNVRREMLTAAKREYYKFVVKIAHEIYVYLMTNQYPGHYDIDLKEVDTKADDFKTNAIHLLDYARETANRIVKKTSEAVFVYNSEDDADFDVNMVVLPIEDKTLCMPYAHNDVLYDLLTKRPEISEYAYWNNVDPPENISDEEWEQRKNDWDEALPGAGVPKDNGMVLHFVEATTDVIEHHYLDIRQNFMCYLEDDKDLLRKVAHNVIIHREFTKLMEERESDDGRSDMTAAMRSLRIATEYIKDHPDEVEETMADYRPMLNSKKFFSVGLFPK